MTRLINTLKFEDVLYGIEGWLFPEESKLLCKLASQVTPENCIVELGSYRGRSTLSMLYGMGENVKFYSVDPRKNWEGEPDHFHNIDRIVFERNLAAFNCQDLVWPISLESHTVGKIWPETGNPKVGLLFIDACHLEACVTADLEAWLPNMDVNGVIAFHDHNTPGIQNSIAKFPQLRLFDTADITGAYHIVAG